MCDFSLKNATNTVKSCLEFVGSGNNSTGVAIDSVSAVALRSWDLKEDVVQPY
jgi:hypothetical protein